MPRSGDLPAAPERIDLAQPLALLSGLDPPVWNATRSSHRHGAALHDCRGRTALRRDRATAPPRARRFCANLATLGCGGEVSSETRSARRESGSRRTTSGIGDPPFRQVRAPKPVSSKVMSRHAQAACTAQRSASSGRRWGPLEPDRRLYTKPEARPSHPPVRRCSRVVRPGLLSGLLAFLVVLVGRGADQGCARHADSLHRHARPITGAKPGMWTPARRRRGPPANCIRATGTP
jgi:hypothetical protein